MSKIQVLSKDLINKIAAGEVVERPASVAKELLENAIDAGASEITVNIEDGGLKKIQVIDNGSGMDENDSQMALMQHATSKISTEKDLESIYTLGFRGEALASISSVSNTTIHTFDGSQNPWLVSIKNEQISVELAPGREKGTTVTVNNIFSNIPARRKFLKSAQTEYKYILNIFSATALANPKVGFKLFKDGRLEFLLKKNDSLLSRITSTFPSLKNSDLIEILYDSPKIKINGYICHPSKARQDSSMQFTFVNGRYVKDNLISKAVREGFSSTLMNNNYPSYFINIQVDTKSIDVNIHPRKMEVRFDDPASIFNSVKTAVNKSLQNALKRDFIQKVGCDTDNITRNYSNYIGRPTVKDGIEFTKNLLSFDLNEQSSSVEKPISSTLNNPFQAFDTYIIFEKEGKLLIVDQHAADERVNYERLQKNFNAGVSFEPLDLLIPIEFQLSKSEISNATTKTEYLKSLGFNFKFSQSKIIFMAIPQLLKQDFTVQVFSEILQNIEDGIKLKGTAEKKENKLIATMACHSSIRAGQKLQSQEMQQLIINLFNCDMPYSCPHGRPIIWELSKYELEKNFKRKI